MARISNLALHGNAVITRDYALNIVTEAGDRLEETANGGGNLIAARHRRRGTKSEGAIFCEETDKALRVHRIDGREELVEVYAFGFQAHCWEA